jgi:hypothetical protein
MTGDGIKWAVTSTEIANWFPITRLSHMLDCQLFGLQPGAHHAVNLLSHALATLLPFAFLHRATKAIWPSAFVAFFFAIHPLHAASVTWISERKDVLSACFWFLTLWLYVRYAERLGAGRFVAVMAAFTVGLMSKPMLVTLPFVLLLVDRWPLRRGWRIQEKLPLFVLSFAGALSAFLVQRGSGAVQAISELSLGTRVENAIVSYGVYLAKTIWPANLAVFYPYTDLEPWQAVRLQPTSARALTDLASALAKTPGRLPEAIADYQAALKLEPDSAIPHSNLGSALSKIPSCSRRSQS